MAHYFIEEDECTLQTTSGLLAIYLICSAFLGYFVFTVFMAIYCFKTKNRRKVNCQEIGKILDKFRSELKQGDFCCICLDEEKKDSVILGCAHGFHKDCLEGWLKIKRLCPVCRAQQ